MKFNLQPEQLPRHIAFIMDGNGRWATRRMLPRKAGHRAGVKAMKKTIQNVADLGIPFMSLYAFSTENQSRPQDEVQALFALMQEYFSEFLQDVVSGDIRVRFMGDLSYFPEQLRQILLEAQQKSKDCKRCVLNIGMNYGGRDEIIRAVNRAVLAGQPVTQQSFSNLLDTDAMPDPDAIIRTGGEMRLSNFMLYQAAYSELIVTPTLWPDFNLKTLYEVLNEFARRNRRFGNV